MLNLFRSRSLIATYSLSLSLFKTICENTYFMKFLYIFVIHICDIHESSIISQQLYKNLSIPYGEGSYCPPVANLNPVTPYFGVICHSSGTPYVKVALAYESSNLYNAPIYLFISNNTLKYISLWKSMLNNVNLLFDVLPLI